MGVEKTVDKKINSESISQGFDWPKLGSKGFDWPNWVVIELKRFHWLLN